MITHIHCIHNYKYKHVYIHITVILNELSFSDMSEADMIYTDTLMQREKEDYTGKEIVILGGGDGGLLWELLKQKPQFVTMLEVWLNSYHNFDNLYSTLFCYQSFF